jgi:hypothetical protein
MSTTEWFFALLGVGFTSVPLGLQALGYPVPRIVAQVLVCVGIVSLCGAFILPVIAFFRPSTVTISPRNLIFREIGQDAMFRITNNTDHDIYSVSFIFRVTPASYSTDDFSVSIPKSSWKALSERGSVAPKFGDMAGMNCRDAKQQSVFFLAVYHLAPQESREINMQLIGGSTVPKLKRSPFPLTPKLEIQHSDKPANVSAEVSHYETLPTDLVVTENGARFPFTLTETLQCSQLVVLKIKQD